MVGLHVCALSARQWLAVYYHVGAGNQTQTTWQEQQVLLTAEPSFQLSLSWLFILVSTQ